MQGNLALDLFLAPSNFRSTQPSTNNHSDALRIRPHCLLYRLLHSTAERNTFLQLLRNRTSNQVGIQFWRTNLDNVQTYPLPGFRLQRSTQLINFLSALSDHNTRFGGMNCHRHLVSGGTLNLNLRDSSIRQLLVKNPFADLKVLG